MNYVVDRCYRIEQHVSITWFGCSGYGRREATSEIQNVEIVRPSSSLFHPTKVASPKLVSPVLSLYLCLCNDIRQS